MKKRLLAALLTSALALSLTACGGGTDSSATDGGNTASTHDGPYKISMVLKTNAAEFWNIVQAGAEAYEDEHPDQVSLDIKGPPAETYYEEQLNTIQTDLAVESYDGYLIAPLQSEAVATAIANTDKPVVAYDTRIDSDKCLAFVGTGNKDAAKEGGKAETQYANATADLAVTAMEGIMSKYPEGVAIICSNNDDMALAAARTAKDNPNYAKTIFLGFDGQKSAVEAVLNGELTMTAAQNNFDIGYKAVETIVKILNGEEYGDVDTGTEIITQDNAQARVDNFANWLI